MKRMVDNTFFIECNAYGANNNKQLLHNENGRPSVLVAKLHYHKESDTQA